MTQKATLAWRLWIVFAQAVAVAAGALIAWRTFSPADVAVPSSSVVSVQESPATSSSPTGSVPAKLEIGFRAAAKKASASVVNIYTRKLTSDNEQTSLGSGVIVTADGYLLTNNHVIEGADQIAVMLPDGKVADARVIGADPESDLAVLRINAKGLQPITLAQPSSVQVGDIVLAVGDPFGVGQTVTQGIVSATGRNRLGINTFENFIQTDAAINPGNSGGALVDTSGHLVGINTAIFSKSGGSQGIGFAIPVSLAKEVMEQIITTGKVRRGWLGVGTRDVVLAESPAESAGAALLQVQPGGPADEAGLRAGDIVLAINGKKVADSNDLINQTTALKPGTRAEFSVRRSSELKKITVLLGERPTVKKR
jgi:Do/DeqQ family serine protease